MKTASVGFLVLGVIVGIILGAVIGYSVFSAPSAPSTPPTPKPADTLTPEAAGERAIEFLTTYAIPQGVEASLASVTTDEQSGLYEIAVTVSMLGATEMREVYMTKDGELLFLGATNIDDYVERVEAQRALEEQRNREQQSGKTIGDYIRSEDPLCTEEGKPIIYFFGAPSCSACQWEHPILLNVTSKFDGYIALHDNMNAIVDSEVFASYNPGGTIPTTVLGCSYYRIGANITLGEAQEEQILTALICDLTEGQPEAVCSAPEIVALMAQLD
ncbi:MAG: TlpA family protein disulfide reductase [Candidatus Methanospirareceae archaeon]